jgi:signal transduction histidine kinase/ActR/RegA family two-component response regulator
VKRWFASLPIHGKLVVTALVVTAVALVVANVSLIAIDLFRYRAAAIDEATVTASVIAENTAAAVIFSDPKAANLSLETVRARPSIRRACLYLPDGTLFAGFGRTAEFACPAKPPTNLSWRVVHAEASVVSNERAIGAVYLEDDLPGLSTRVVVAGVTAFGTLVIAGTAAFLLAYRVQRWVSRPITRLAAAARGIRATDPHPVLPDIETTEDEVGELTRAFTEMLKRVQAANAEREHLLAREREASRLKDEFLAAVSHELRTPLNAIVGWVQILTTTNADRQTTDRAIASIARNAKAQARVINDLVDVSRIITGKLDIRFDPVDLRPVTEGAVDAIRSSAEGKGVTLSVRLPNAACFVNGDRDRLQQIVWNLLSNAIKFTPRGGAVTVTLRSEANAFEMAVSDTGIGIPPAFLPHVFDRFRQADGSITREHGGLGLGLAIVKELAELHGGAVQASSAGSGRGATFSVRLPRLAGLHVAETGENPPDEEVALLAGLDILAVDDNADALDVLASTLAAAGASVRVATGGEDALREWDRAPADVLVCDLAMPHVDGFSVLRSIRDRDRATGRVTPAIALTAHASAAHQVRAQDAGFDAHVSKPFDSTELIQTILGVRERAQVPLRGDS